MRRVGLTVTALSLVVFAGFAASRAGWFRSPPPRPAAIRPCGQAPDRAGRQADLRYLQNQPRHWTYLLMHR
ncbi:MAG TPA: hypothetical protein VKD72_27825 [Gemmataceae bacterium]|nr:hypothetical protein [Gemmataceae bacterium]